MFEFHIATDRERGAIVLSEAERALFRDDQAEIRAIALASWEEHCTECAWPDCYSTCDLYESRSDGHCRRFVHGMEEVSGLPTLTGLGCAIQFKRWGKLRASMSTTALTLPLSRPIERGVVKLDHRADAARHLGLAGRDQLPVRLQKRLKRALVEMPVVGRRPDYLLIEVLHRTSEPVSLSLSATGPGDDPFDRYQQRIDLAQGLNRVKIPFADIEAATGRCRTLDVELTPNINEPEEEGLELIFGSLALVSDAKWRGYDTPSGEAASILGTDADAPVKVVVWDLDNTVWDGVLVEQGVEAIVVRPSVVETIRQLDRRGIVNSICSKNDPEIALEALERFAIADFFVFSEVSWEPKSRGLERIIRRFNVGPDTVVFIDDQEFERAEVARAHPAVRLIDGAEPVDLLHLPAFDPEVSPESSQRRRTYQLQGEREEALEATGGDYEAFLRESAIEITMVIDAEDSLQRIHELVQRTNQMNFSGTRYTLDQLDDILADDSLDSYTISVRDRFGDYGTVGFGVVERASATMIDLAFSCRVQSKTVEHGVIADIMRAAQGAGHDRFLVRYRPTERNRPSTVVFDDLGFVEESDTDGVRTVRFDLSQPVPDVSTVTVITLDRAS